MNEHLTYQLQNLRKEVVNIPYTDVLATVHSKKVLELEITEFSENFTLTSNAFQQKLLKEAKQHFKESNTNTLSLSIGTVFISHQENELEIPLLIIPLTFDENKVLGEIRYFPMYTDYQVNPFLFYFLKDKFELELEQAIEDESFEAYLEKLVLFLRNKGLNKLDSSKKFIGNFHPHRFLLVKDLDGLLETNSYSSVLLSLLDEKIEEESKNIPTCPYSIYPSDADQQAFLKQIEHENSVLQGPPGTGKSHVLANILAKNIYTNQSTLVLSEKKVALVVLMQKLANFNLHHFAFIAHNQIKASEFVKHLKQTWEFLEQEQFEEKSNFLVSENYTQQLQQLLERLRSTDLMGGISLRAFKKRTSNLAFEEVPFIANSPSIVQFDTYSSDLKTLFEAENVVKILSFLNWRNFQQTEHVEKEIEMLCELYLSLSQTFDLKDVELLYQHIKQTSIIQILEHKDVLIYHEMVKNKKRFKQFQKLTTLYTQAKSEYDIQFRSKNNWKREPSYVLIESWLEVLSSGSWLKKRKVKAEIKSNLAIQTEEFERFIMEWKTFLEIENKLHSIHQELIAFGIHHPEQELPQLEMIHYQLSKFEISDWEKTMQLDASYKNALIESKNQLVQFKNKLDFFFVLDKNEDLNAFIKNLQFTLSSITSFKKTIQKIPIDFQKTIGKANSFADLEKLVLKSNFVQFESLFPQLANLKGADILAMCDRITQLENEENIAFAENICFEQQKKFRAFHTLIQSRNSVLSPAEKELKRTLKTGKSQLVKAFCKSKNHASIRQFMESEARVWIDVLCPVFFSTPTQIAEIFPLQKNLFSCLLMDEASQIPLSHAVGALQRTERAIIVGDSQQMAPTFYFSKQEDRIDMLNHARFYWKESVLTHHYRSQHASLISFSNKHFYENKLHVFPVFPPKQNSLVWHYVENGRFINRKNIQEAEKLVSILIQEIHSNQRIGVVAFSEIQLQTIFDSIPAIYIEKVEEKLENGTLFFKPLEQVQGDECDVLLISFGYAKDEEDKFHMRFAALNKSNGSKRLNVLFTRATQKIHFISSVTSRDFSISVNEGVDLLRQFMIQLEKNQGTENIPLFKPTLNIYPSDNKLIFQEIETSFQDAKTLKTYISVLKSRNWKVKIDI